MSLLIIGVLVMHLYAWANPEAAPIVVIWWVMTGITLVIFKMLEELK